MEEKNTKIPDQDYYYNFARRKTDWTTGDLKRAVDFIKEKFLSGELKRMVEVGCGMAEILEHIPEDIDYYGLDPAQVCIENNAKKYPRATFKVDFAEELPFPDNSFDLIFSHQVLEMLYDPRQSLKEMMRVVRRGGYVIIIAPNLESPLAMVHSMRHYSLLKKSIFTLKRFGDVILRTLGVLPFRIIPINYVQATGKFEKSDDDLKYITSSYEVATLFKRNGFIELSRKDINYTASSLKNLLKKMMVKIPVLRYYNSGMFFIFKRIQ